MHVRQRTASPGIFAGVAPRALTNRNRLYSGRGAIVRKRTCESSRCRAPFPSGWLPPWYPARLQKRPPAAILTSRRNLTVQPQLRFAALLIAQIAAAQTYTVLHTFTGADGGEPYGTPLVLDGITYGTTMSGGAYGAGTVYSWDGTTLTTLYSFGGFPGDGLDPMGGLAAGPGGLLYGTTTAGGANNAGTVYSISLAGQEQVVSSLPATSTNPTGGVTFDPSAPNRLYGTTSQPGAIFSYNLKNSIFMNQDTSNPCLGTLTYYKGSMYGTSGPEVFAAN